MCLVVLVVLWKLSRILVRVGVRIMTVALPTLQSEIEDFPERYFILINVNL